MRKYNLIQLRKSQNGNSVFIELGKISDTENRQLESIKDFIYDLGNVACWNNCWKEGDKVEKYNLIFNTNSRFTGIVNGDFFILPTNTKQKIQVCLPIGWQAANTVDEAEHILQENIFLNIY